jgi:hypothetical protein
MNRRTVLQYIRDAEVQIIEEHGVSMNREFSRLHKQRGEVGMTGVVQYAKVTPWMWLPRPGWAEKAVAPMATYTSPLQFIHGLLILRERNNVEPHRRLMDAAVVFAAAESPLPRINGGV